MNEFQKGLVTGNYDLVGKFIEMFGLDANEYEDALAVWLCEAACNWKDESVSFRKYAKKCIGVNLRKELTKRERDNDRLIYYYAEGLHNIDKKVADRSMQDIVLFRLDKRDKRVHNVMKLLEAGYNCEEVSAILGIDALEVASIGNYIKQDIFNIGK